MQKSIRMRQGRVSIMFGSLMQCRRPRIVSLSRGAGYSVGIRGISGQYDVTNRQCTNDIFRMRESPSAQWSRW